MRQRLTLSALCLAFVTGMSAPAHGVVYDFDHQVWGNAGIALNNAAGRQTFVEITENLATPENDVLFKFTNHIPPENTNPYGDAAIKYVYFDTGNFTDLITAVSIWEQSAGVLLTVPGQRPNMDLGNSFDTYFTENFSAGLGAGYPADKHVNGVNPGEYLVLNVTLGPGKTFADLINALDVGRDPNEVIARTGLRVSEIVHRIWGVSADDDHAAFVLARPVPLQITALSATPSTILDNQTSQLSVAATDLEPGPSALSYQWTIVSGGGMLNDAFSATPIYMPSDVVGTQDVTIRVEVSDGANATSSTIKLGVNDANAPPPNQPPQISALTATPATLLDTETSQLAVTASDPDNGPQALTYQWSIISGGGVLDNATTPNPTYTPADVVGNQSVTLRAVVSDGAVSTSGDLTLQVQDANPPPPGAEMLVEDFSSGTFPGWTVHDEGPLSGPSKWHIVSGQLTQQSSIADSGGTADLARLGTYLSYDDGLGWTAYRLKFTSRTTSDDDTWGIMFRVRDANNYYRLTWDMQRKQRRLVKKEGGVFTLLAADSVPYVQYRTYQVEVVTQGTQLEVWVDGVRIFQVTDAAHANGTIAFHNWLQNATFFDNVRVEDLSGGNFNAVPRITAVTASPSTILDTEISNLTVTANDPDGGPQALSYQWTIVNGGGMLDYPNSTMPVYTPSDVVGTRSVTIRVDVSDGAVSVGSDLILQVQDANPPPLGPELLAEDFSSGTIAGWTVHDEGTPAPSKWRIVSGQLTQQSSISDGGGTADLARLGTYLSYDEGLGWTDYRLKFTSLTTNDDDTWGIMFRVRDANNYYRFTWDMQRKQRRLVKKEGGVFTLLAADSVPYVQNRPYQVEVVTQGTQLEVWIDNVRIFQVTDAAHASGTMAFHNWLQNATFFDDVRVNAMQ
jgi:hypothetical protein